MAHILIVDDEPMIRFLVRRVLESADHKVSEAQDGQVALNLLVAYPHQFNIIILDLQMPRMGGIEFLAALQNEISYPPVIVLTAHMGSNKKTLGNNVFGHLNKPFRTRDLIDMVNTQLNIHRVPSLV